MYRRKTRQPKRFPLEIRPPKTRTINQAAKSQTKTNTIPHIKTLQSNQRIRNDKKHTPHKEILGHRNINSTLVYTHLVPVDDEAENYHHATAKDEKEAGELIEQAWQYVCTTPQGIIMFRKAKKRNE
jgi:hypothetical protein